MIINLNKYTSVTYSLHTNNADGELLETVDSTKPIDFIFGQGQLLPAFENHLNGLTVDDDFEFSIPCQDAYGEIKDELLVKLNKGLFEQNGVVNEQLLTIGNQIPMQDSKGNRMNGIVREVNEDTVLMDFNHPLAGKDLYFIGKIVGVREATYEELNPPAHQCGCGSNTGSCSTEPEHEHAHSDEGCGCGNSSCGC